MDKVQLRISIADRQAMANVLGRAKDKSSVDISEDLIAVLRPNVIEIQLPREYLSWTLSIGQTCNGRIR
jgi:hypothetical protein